MSRSVSIFSGEKGYYYRSLVSETYHSPTGNGRKGMSLGSPSNSETFRYSTLFPSSSERFRYWVGFRSEGRGNITSVHSLPNKR